MPLSCKMVTLKVNMMKMAEYYIKYISKYISSCMKTFIFVRITSKLKYFIRNIILIIKPQLNKDMQKNALHVCVNLNITNINIL